MANKTISLPDDVLPIIETLGIPFSRWVTEQLRLHAATQTKTFGEQLRTDAELARRDASDVGQRPNAAATKAKGAQMERSASW